MNNTVKKIVAGVTALTCAAWMMGPGVAQALTVDQLLEMIATATSLEDLQEKIAAAQAEEEEAAPAIEGCTITSFDRNLKQGMSGDDVNCLQIVLNSDSDTQLAEEGVGSPGNETSYFGPLTKAAVIKFQEKYADEVLASWGLTEGTGYVGSTTRAKLNELLAGAEEEEEEEVPAVEEPTASLASDTPAAASLPLGARSVPILKVVLSAADDDITIGGLTFKRTGLGKAGDWPDLYLYANGNRITDIGRSISADTQQVEFPALNIEILAGESKSITLRADVTSDTAAAGHVSIFSLVSIESTATFAGLPVAGNTMGISSIEVSEVIVEGGSVSNPVVGSEGAEIAVFDITAGDQDVELSEVILSARGSLSPSDVTNLELYSEDDEEILAESAGIDDEDYITFALEELYTIPDSLTRTFSVRADLGGRVGDSLDTQISSSNDLLVIDKVYGYGAEVTAASFPVSCGSIILEGGILSLADQGPAAGDVAKNQQDVVLTKIGMTGSRDLEVRGLTVDLTLSATTTDITDLRIKDADTGATLMQEDLAEDEFAATTTTKSYGLSGPFNLSADETRNIVITVDIGSDAKEVDIAADLSMTDIGSGYVYIRDAVTGDYLSSSDVIPSSVSGNDQTIVAANLLVRLASTPTSKTVITGAKDVEALGIAMKATGGTDVTVRDLYAKVYVNSATSSINSNTSTDEVTASEVVQVARLYQSGTLLDQVVLDAKSVSGHDYGLAEFEDLGIEIAKDHSTKLVVEIDTASHLTSIRYVAIEVEKGDIDARDPDNRRITGLTGTINDCDGSPERVVTVDTAGTLTMSPNTGETPKSANLAVGTEGAEVTLLAFDLEAEKEAVEVKELAVTRTDTAGYADAAAYSTLYLYDESGLVDNGFTAFAAGATTTLFDNISVVVPADGEETLTIKVDLAGIDEAVSSGDKVKITVAPSSITDAVGVSSEEPISCSGSSAASKDQYLYKTVVNVAVSDDTPEGLGYPGMLEEVLYLDFINGGEYDATLNNATFTVDYNAGESGVTTTTDRTFKLYDTTGDEVATATASMTGGIDGATIAFSAIDFTLPPGTTKIILKGDTGYVVTGKGVYQSFNVNDVSDIVWNDGTTDVAARHFVAPLTGGTLTYGY